MLLGCIADDFTGATDLANTLSRHGMRTVQIIGVPTGLPPDTDAIVIALKSRTIPAKDAVAQSLAACRWLKQHGARQIYFKYCSTFDSTDAGNIGPVADALLDELGLISPSPVRHFRKMAGRSTWGISSSARGSLGLEHAASSAHADA